MDRLISVVQGAAMVALLVVMVVGYWAVGVTAAQAQSSCEEDPYCHVGMRGSPLYAIVAACDAPNCNTRSQICCIEFEW